MFYISLFWCNWNLNNLVFMITDYWDFVIVTVMLWSCDDVKVCFFLSRLIAFEIYIHSCYAIEINISMNFFCYLVGSVELAAVGVSVSVFNLVSKLFNVPLLSITTSFVAEEQSSLTKGANESSPSVLGTFSLLTWYLCASFGFVLIRLINYCLADQKANCCFHQYQLLWFLQLDLALQKLLRFLLALVSYWIPLVLLLYVLLTIQYCFPAVFLLLT